jgi:hypothetical protein
LPRVYKNLKRIKWRTPKVDKNEIIEPQAHTKKSPMFKKINCEDLME